MKVTIRRFEKKDIIKKVEWINNPENNQFLHYDIPISILGTEKWYENHKGDNNRFDAIIEVDDIAVGTIGLLNIDKQHRKAEYYIAMGEVAYKGKGVAKEATKLLLNYGFEECELNRIYLYTEKENVTAQKLFEKVGFVREGILRQDLLSKNKFVDRVIYSFLREDWKK